MGVIETIRRWANGPNPPAPPAGDGAEGEERTLTLSELDALLDLSAAGAAASSAGLWVDQNTALTSAVVYACVNVLAQTIASLPLITYRRLPNGGKERAPEHRLYSILHDQPNPEMTSYELRAALVGHVCLWGNAYAEIELSDAGVNALWPLRPDRMTPTRDESNDLVYDYRLPSGQTKRFAAYQIMHWRGLSSNGIVGYSPIQLAAESIGIDLATRQFGASFFGNNSQPGGILTHPGRLTEASAERLKKSWQETHQGLSNAHRVAVLEEGVTWTSIGIPPEQAQFLETRKYGRSEIAALFRIPLHLINDLERATFSNIEHQSLEFVKYTLMPWLVQIEQAIRRDLFAVSEGKRSHFAEHLVDGLLRGDIVSRFQAYQIARQNGWLNADDIRAIENMNPIGGEVGSSYLWPANMVPAQIALEPPAVEQGSEGAGEQGSGGAEDDAAEDEDEEEEGERGLRRRALTDGGEARRRALVARRRAARGTFAPLIADAAARVLRRERVDVLRKARGMLANGDRAAFERWLRTYYEEQKGPTQDTFTPSIRALMKQISTLAAEEMGGDRELDAGRREGFEAAFAERQAGEWTGKSLWRLLETLDAEEDGLMALEEQFDAWETSRPGQEGFEQSVRAAEAIAKLTFLALGAQTLRWYASGTSCPYCAELDGQVVGIERTFLGKGATLQPAGAEGPLTVSGDVGHAPLHAGCDCSVGPG